jgi:hypothetical protein
MIERNVLLKNNHCVLVGVFGEKSGSPAAKADVAGNTLRAHATSSDTAL